MKANQLNFYELRPRYKTEHKRRQTKDIDAETDIFPTLSPKRSLRLQTQQLSSRREHSTNRISDSSHSKGISELKQRKFNQIMCQVENNEPKLSKKTEKPDSQCSRMQDFEMELKRTEQARAFVRKIQKQKCEMNGRFYVMKLRKERKEEQKKKKLEEAEEQLKYERKMQRLKNVHINIEFLRQRKRMRQKQHHIKQGTLKPKIKSRASSKRVQQSPEQLPMPEHSSNSGQEEVSMAGSRRKRQYGRITAHNRSKTSDYIDLSGEQEILQVEELEARIKVLRKYMSR